MSWFDRGIANLAKTALKEAQKQIDKALDIREEDENAISNVDKTSTSKTAPMQDHPRLRLDVENKRLANSTWGSFSGSFFENPNASEMVTTAPKVSSTPILGEEVTSTTTTPATTTTTTIATTVKQPVKRSSVTSNSDSVELLSPSDVATPPETNVSESIELITSASNITTPEECSSAAGPMGCGTDSIVIIGSNDEEEDSLSYSTVMDETITATTGATILPALAATSFDECRDQSSGGSLTPRTIGQSNKKGSRDDASDSTQSFEDVQMLASTDTVLDSNRDSMLDDKFDLQHMVMTSTTSYSSPHNSNDENDTNTTTTSSDIEIISNPNGDSSSTHSNSRFSSTRSKKLMSTPSTVQAGMVFATTTSKKGHCREPSEISVLSEDSQTEIDKLTHRINELMEQLEARESQLLQSERENTVLQDRNTELKSVLEAVQTNTANLDSSSDDYTQRLSALEKKFQASIRERNALRIQIQELKDDLRSKVPKEQSEQMTAERDQMIAELRQEGEKLSKEILQQSNIIKKLRAKEKSTDATLKKNTLQIQELTEETERLKKSLNAKEDMERTHIEAVHKISSEKRRLEEETSQQRSQIEDLQMKLETMQASFDAVKDELQQRSRVHLDLSRKADEVQETNKALENLKAENKSLSLQLSELQEKLRFVELSLTRREQQLREENKQLLNRLESAELRAENSTQDVTEATVPLMRQIESLQNSLSQRTLNWSKEEKLLLERIETTQTRLKSLEHVEETYKEKVNLLQARCLELEEKLSATLIKSDQSAIELHRVQKDISIKEKSLTKKITELNDTLQESKLKIEALEKQNKTLEEQLVHSISSNSVKAINSSTDDLLHAKLSTSSVVTQQEIEGRDLHILHQQQPQQSQLVQNSPPNSVGVNSFEDAMYGSFDWHADDEDCVSNSDGRNNLALMSGFNFMGHNNTSTIEQLQSILKQRDGELHHIQWEMSRLQSERGVLNEEINNLTLELENVKEKLQVNESLETNFNDLQHRYDELLQMYGEAVERTEELELDLYESREAYKKQIEELLALPPSSKPN